MAKADWNFMGTGGYGIQNGSPSGSGTKVLSLTSTQRMIYKSQPAIGNTEVVYWVKHRASDWNLYGEVWLRLQAIDSLDDGYVVRTYGAGSCAYIYRVEGGSETLLASEVCPISLGGVWRKLRVRIKGYEIQVAIWEGATWNIFLAIVDVTSKWASGAAGIGHYHSAGGAFQALFDEIDIGEETP